MKNFQFTLVMCFALWNPVFGNVNQFSYLFMAEECERNAGNVIFSPASIVGALNMILHGAKGDTKDQILSAVGGQESSEVLSGLKQVSEAEANSQPLKVSDRIWVDNTTKILDSFKTQHQNEMTGVSFIQNADSVHNQINDWVFKAADIKELFKQGSIDHMTRLVLVNVINFKGQWKTPFDKELTRKIDFLLEDGTKKKIEIMFQNGDFKMLNEDTHQSVEVPYKGDEYSLVVTMPKKKSTKINDFIGQLSHQKMQQVFDRLKSLAEEKNIARGELVYGQSIDLFFPKFMASSEFDLKDTLTKMGVHDLFEQGVADLSGITGDRSLYCSTAVHQAKIEINEEGTKASAATGIGIAAMSLPPQFVVNRPFLFHILHRESGTIIFAGVVKDLGK